MIANGQNVFFREMVDDFVVELTPLVERVSVSVGGPVAPGDDVVWVLFPPHEAASLGLDWMFQDPAIASRSMGICAEQPGTIWFDNNVPLARTLGAVFDISPLGAAALNTEGVAAERLLLGARPGHTPANTHRDIDLVAMWASTGRRAAVERELLPLLDGLNVVVHAVTDERPVAGVADGYVGGRNRDELLRRAKLVLNVHRTGTPYFEWHRAVRAMEAGALFVNESDVGAEPLVTGREFVSLDGPFGDDVDWQHVAQRIRDLCANETFLEERRADMAAWLQRHPLAASAEQLLAAAQRIVSSTTPAARFHKGPDHMGWKAAESTRLSYATGQRPASVELWGSFDEHGLGTQLLPVIAEHVLRTLRPGSAVTLASPQGGAVPGWLPSNGALHAVAPTSRRIIKPHQPGFFDQLGEMDGVIITDSYSPSPVGHLLLSARVPIAWHAHRVPGPPDPAAATALTIAADNLLHRGVADQLSSDHMATIGITTTVDTNPLWAIPDVWPRHLLLEHQRALVDEGRVPPNPYLCLGTENLSTRDRARVALQINLLAAKGIDVVRMTHDALDGEPATVPDRVAALAGSAGCLATDVDTGIVAAAYGVPHAWFADSAEVRSVDEAVGGGHLILVGDIAAVGAAMIAGEHRSADSLIAALQGAAVAELVASITAIVEHTESWQLRARQRA